MKPVRMTFSLAAEGELAGRMAEYNKHERAVIVKEALLSYFGLVGRLSVRSAYPVANEQPAQAEIAAVPVLPQVANVLGDFED